MAVDLHSHSTASDGSVAPAGLVDQAAAIGLTALALTDHDTQQGVAEAQHRADEKGIELIPGTELSLFREGGGMHLVVLWLKPGTGPLQDRLAELRRGRDRRNERIVEKLNAAGMRISIGDVVSKAGGGSVGRPHIAAVMVEKGYADSLRSAFDLWLGNRGPAYVERLRLNPEEGIALARQSGAVPILAHPHTLGIHRAQAMADLLAQLRAAGLVGLESVYSSYRQHERDGFSHLARRFGLVPSGGSDYHGSFKPGLELGVGYGDLVVSESTLEELRTYSGVP